MTELNKAESAELGVTEPAKKKTRKRKPAPRAPAAPQFVYYPFPQNAAAVPPGPPPTTVAGAINKLGGDLTGAVTSGTLQSRLVNTGIVVALALTGFLGLAVYLAKDPVLRYIDTINRINEAKEEREKRNAEEQTRIKSQIQNFEQIYAIGRRVDEKLKDNLADLRSSRLIVLYFHGKAGGNDVEKDYLFASARNWQPIDAVNDTNRRFRDQNIGHLQEMTEHFSQSRCWIVARLNVATSSHKVWLDRDSKSLISCPIRDLNRQIIGGLIAEYDNSFEESEGFVLESRVQQIASAMGGVIQSQTAIQGNN